MQIVAKMVAPPTLHGRHGAVVRFALMLAAVGVGGCSQTNETKPGCSHYASSPPLCTPVAADAGPTCVGAPALSGVTSDAAYPLGCVYDLAPCGEPNCFCSTCECVMDQGRPRWECAE